MPLWANATALVSASAVANPIAARFMAFPYDHPRTRSACRGGVTDEKPRPAGQQQGGGPIRSRRVRIAPWDEPIIGPAADNSRVCDLENRAILHRIGPE